MAPEFGEMTVDSNNLAGFYAQGHHYKEAKRSLQQTYRVLPEPF